MSSTFYLQFQVLRFCSLALACWWRFSIKTYCKRDLQVILLAINLYRRRQCIFIYYCY